MTTLEAATFAHLAASLLLFGAAAFPIYAKAKAPVRLLRWAGAVAFGFGVIATTLHVQALQAPLPDLAQTGIGRIWIGQCMFAAIAAVLAFGNRTRAVAVIAGVNVAPFAVVGHAYAIAGWSGAAVEALHLLAAGAWIGGAVALMLSLRAAPDAAIVQRFAAAAIGFVVVLALSGAATLFQITGAPLPMAAFSYGVIAWSKIALFGVALAFAAFNRLYATPRSAWRVLMMSTVLEVLILGAVLALAVRLAGTEPLG